MCRAHGGQRVVFMEGEEEPPEDLRLAEDLDYSSRSVLYDHLIDMGRARNRKFDALPVWAEQGWREVVTMRSNAQLKRCLETKPVFANASNEELHRYRERDVGWSGTAASSSRVSDSKDSSKGRVLRRSRPLEVVVTRAATKVARAVARRRINPNRCRTTPRIRISAMGTTLC